MATTPGSLALQLRAMTWTPLAVAALASTGVVALQHGQHNPVPLQAAAILLSSAAGFALDDPSAEVLGASPLTLLRRRLVRLRVMGLPVATMWVALLWWQGAAGPEEAAVVTILFVGLLGLSLGVAGIAGRRTDGARAGIAAAPALFILLILSSTVPEAWRPLPMGDVPGGWAQLAARWGANAVVGTMAFLVSSRDPAARWKR